MKTLKDIKKKKMTYSQNRQNVHNSTTYRNDYTVIVLSLVVIAISTICMLFSTLMFMK